MSAGRLGEGTPEVGLARTGGSGDENDLVLPDPVTAGETKYDGLVDASWGSEVDVLEGGTEAELGELQKSTESTVLSLGGLAFEEHGEPILEGEGLLRYKQNLLNHYREVAGHDLDLSLAPSLWEWKRGQGYTLPLTRDRKSEVAAVLSGRPFFKLARFVPTGDPAVRDGQLVEIARQAFRAILPVITP